MYRFWILIIALSGVISCSNKGSDPAGDAPSNLTLQITEKEVGSGTYIFEAKADNALSYEINFGNNQKEVSKTGKVEYTYLIAGKYTVTATARSANGITISKTEELEFSRPEKLVWADEFNVPGGLDSKKWTHEIGNGENGWGNAEKQYYTDRSANSYISDGTLKIKLIKENYEGFGYTSARIVTRGKFDFTYGRVEIRAKVPVGKGTWPAGWLLGSNYQTKIWPACGEIDILEHVGKQLNTIHGTLHYPEHHGENATTKTTELATATTNFHVYSVDWNKDEIIFKVDGKAYHTFKSSPQYPFHHDFFIILNMAMGGYFGGDVDPSINEAIYEIDYVRVYQ